jgi:hypothetical protein
MLLSATQDHTTASLGLIEGCLTAILAAAAFVAPRLGSGWFSRIERMFAGLARKKGLMVAAIGLAALLLRLAILPFKPIPLPFIPDDFSFLLSANTFALGRLTNPTPALWTHFESIHISMLPTYMSMYFPGQGLVLALGKVLFGNPWFGQLIVSALMCAAICWMLQAWLPPSWALLGGILAVLRLGLFSYWVNSYTGGGLLTALGGALILGALPRLMKTVRPRYGLLIGIGIGIAFQVITRPYEGMLLCLPVAFVLGRWALIGKNRPSPGVLIRRAALPLAIVVAAAAWLGYYDYRAFGKATTLPYTLNRAQYAVAPYYVWQSQRPEPEYRHDSIRRFYHDAELTMYHRAHSLSGFPAQVGLKVFIVLLFYGGMALFPPLFMVRRVFLDRRIRFLVVCVLVLSAGMLIEIYMIPHYVAAYTAAFYALGLQAMRHLRLWAPEHKPVGLQMVRISVSLCVVLAGVRLFNVPLHLSVPEWPASNWSGMWYGPDRYGTERAQIESRLESLPDKQLVLVREPYNRDSLDQWVYNDPDIDHSKVVWANDMSPADNRQLIEYYRDRKVWLVEMDTLPATVSPYPMPVQLTPDSR